MKLTLYENIKKLRKNKGMTQEELAEFLGVTVGAVSKWENGNNTPDIVMLTILADFFDVSVDVLLGYEISSKRVKNIVDEINSYTMKHMFMEAESIAKDGLSRYPHDFTVVYTAAKMYHVKAVECKDIEAAKESIRLFEKSKDYLAQNDDPNINDFTISNMIATNYLFFDNRKALKIFKENNYAGVNNSMISFVLLKDMNVEESLNYSTNAMIGNLFGFITSAIYMMLALAGIGKKDKYNEGLDLADSVLQTIEYYKTDKVGYFNKYEVLIMVMKAYLYAALKDDKMMLECLKTGKKLALEFDENSSNDVAQNFKFYHNMKKSFVAIDSIGASAYNGVIESLNDQFLVVEGLDKKIIKKIEDYWIGTAQKI